MRDIDTRQGLPSGLGLHSDAHPDHLAVRRSAPARAGQILRTGEHGVRVRDRAHTRTPPHLAPRTTPYSRHPDTTHLRLPVCNCMLCSLRTSFLALGRFPAFGVGLLCGVCRLRRSAGAFPVALAAVLILTACTGQERAGPFAQSEPILERGPQRVTTAKTQSRAGVPVSAEAHSRPVPLPLLQTGTSAARLARAALRESDRTSPARDLLVQRQQERVAAGRRRWPQIEPVASLNQEADVSVGVRATVVLYDFGRAKAEQAQADRAIDLARLDLWSERIDSVREVLGYLVDAGEAQARRAASTTSLGEVAGLRGFAQSRVGAGIADQSEQLLFDVRLAELRNEIDADTAALGLALGQIASATKRPFLETALPSLVEIGDALGAVSTKGDPPDLARARLTLALAEQDLELAGARRFPSVQLGGTVLSDGRTVTPGATLTLGTSDFPGFSGRPALLAARAALSSARAGVARAARDLETEAGRIALERVRLESRMASLARLEQEARLSVDLFLEQQDLGGRPLTDGITVHRTLLETRRNLVRANADLLRLRLEDAARTGVLVGQEGE